MKRLRPEADEDDCVGLHSLPADVVQLICARLPLASLLAARSASTRWRQAVSKASIVWNAVQRWRTLTESEATQVLREASALRVLPALSELRDVQLHGWQVRVLSGALWQPRLDIGMLSMVAELTRGERRVLVKSFSASSPDGRYGGTLEACAVIACTDGPGAGESTAEFLVGKWMVSHWREDGSDSVHEAALLRLGLCDSASDSWRMLMSLCSLNNASRNCVPDQLWKSVRVARNASFQVRVAEEAPPKINVAALVDAGAWDTVAVERLALRAVAQARLARTLGNGGDALEFPLNDGAFVSQFLSCVSVVHSVMYRWRLIYDDDVEGTIMWSRFCVCNVAVEVEIVPHARSMDQGWNMSLLVGDELWHRTVVDWRTEHLQVRNASLSEVPAPLANLPLFASLHRGHVLALLVEVALASAVPLTFTGTTYAMNVDDHDTVPPVPWCDPCLTHSEESADNAQSLPYHATPFHDDGMDEDGEEEEEEDSAHWDAIEQEAHLSNVAELEGRTQDITYHVLVEETERLPGRRPTEERYCPLLSRDAFGPLMAFH